ncbi:MAG TPA: ATP-grasp domain-containing protein [Kofleriaceae bacterium]|jgi:argininosuccinate lyase|nr:ATP-grasp domain-containing protein [Kofleriaceae bacterium]
MTGALVFVESNTTGTGRLMARTAIKLGFRPIVLAANTERYAYVRQDNLAVRAIDTQSEFDVREACRVIADTEGLAGVTSSSEYFVGVAAAVAEQLGRPAPPAAAIRACSDKSIQRRLLDQGGIAVSAWRRAATVAEAVAAALQLGWPAVLKPVSGSGSIGVKLCRDVEEVADHAAVLLARDVNERGMKVPQALLVESFVDGAEYSVEVFSLQIIGITAKRLGQLPHFVEIGHDFTAELTGRARAEIEGVTLGALRALGLERGPVHVELRVGPHGPVIIEVNPRLAGGFIPELVRLARGVDLIESNVRFASGSPVALDAKWQRHASIRFLLAPNPGVLAEVRGLDAAARVRNVVDATAYRAVGDAVTRCGDFRDRVGHVIACGADRDEVIGDIAAAHRSISLLVTPARSETASPAAIASSSTERG